VCSIQCSLNLTTREITTPIKSCPKFHYQTSLQNLKKQITTQHQTQIRTEYHQKLLKVNIYTPHITFAVYRYIAHSPHQRHPPQYFTWQGLELFNNYLNQITPLDTHNEHRQGKS